VVTIPFFLSGDSVVGMGAMLDHIDYMVELIGIDHVGIGTDWPMHFSARTNSRIFSPSVLTGWGFRDEHRVDPNTALDGFADYRDFPNITRGLVSRGYSDDDIKKILGENFLRVFEAVCG